MGKFAKTMELPETDCTRQDIYNLMESLDPTADLVNTDVLNVLGQKITAGDRLPYWRKYSVSHAALQTGALTNNIEVFQLPAGGVLHGLKVKHGTAFAGTGITDYKVDIGVTGTLAKFISAFDVDSAVSDSNLRMAWAPFWASLVPAAFVNTDNAIGSLTISAAYSQAEVQALRAACETLADDARALRASLAALFAGATGSESHGSATSVRVQATSVGANLSASTAGALDIWALYSVET